MQLFLSLALEAPGAARLEPGPLRARMEERFAWAVGRGHAVAALACEPLGLEVLEGRSPGLSSRVLGALAAALGPVFAAAEAHVVHEARHLVVLLVGPDPQRMEAACREWIARLKELRVDGVAGTLPVQLRLGYAVSQPGQRLFLDTLVEVALEGLRVARCRAPGACVHTALYNLLQARLEGERGVEGLTVTASEPLSPGTPAREPGIDGASSTPATSSSPRVPNTPRVEPSTSAHEPLVAGRAPAREAPSEEPGSRERELLAALATARRENEALQLRLRALEGPTRVPGDSRGTPDAPTGLEESAQERIHRLERRLEKLRALLVEAEERLARAAREEAVDPGLPSRFRTVQGLAVDAPLRDLKAGLMEQLFTANLELQEALRLRRAS